MGGLRAKIEITTRTLEMLVSAINSKHAQLEADAKEAALFVRWVANARANEKLRQKRKANASKLRKRTTCHARDC